MRNPSLGVTFRLVNRLNRLFCRVMYQVTPPSPPPLPERGPVLLVSDHPSLSDPMVLSATAGRPITYLVAREVFQRPYLRWMYQTFHYIPVSRGNSDVKAVRAMLRVLEHGEVVGIFPQGGIDEYRKESGHLGVGYLALKTGVPVVPASIAWDSARPLNLFGALATPGKAIVRYGTPIVLRPDPNPSRDQIRGATASIMLAIRELRPLKC